MQTSHPFRPGSVPLPALLEIRCGGTLRLSLAAAMRVRRDDANGSMDEAGTFVNVSLLSVAPLVKM